MPPPDSAPPPSPPTPGDLLVDGRPYPVEALIAALTPHVLADRHARMQTVLDHRLASIALGIEDLHHSHNGSACLRTAEALGVQDVVAAELRHAYPLPEPPETTANPDPAPNEVNRKVSMAAHRWIDLHRVDRSADLITWARARAMHIFGAGPRGTLTLDALPVDQPMLLLFGNERDGLRDATLAACDDAFRIPMVGFTESFNISVSVGITLAATTARVRARLAAQDRTGDLPPDRRRQLLARWLLGDVRGASSIVRRKLG